MGGVRVGAILAQAVWPRKGLDPGAFKINSRNTRQQALTAFSVGVNTTRCRDGLINKLPTLGGPGRREGFQALHVITMHLDRVI